MGYELETDDSIEFPKKFPKKKLSIEETFVKEEEE